jgi:macrolide transport system ATP-binding/permease protein
MEQLRVLLSRVLSLFQRRQLDDRLREEMETHLAMQAEENRRRGMASDDAHYAALRAFGGVEQTAEAHRDQRGFAWLDALRQDLLYARRTLAKSPGFLLTAVAILSLAIGANTALFTLFDGYLLKPIPIPDAQRNFEVYASRNQASGAHIWSYADYQAFRQNNTAFVDTYAYSDSNIRILEPEPREAHALFVSGSYFTVLGGKTISGRPIMPFDDQVPGRDAVVVLSNSGWQRLFHGDAFVVGKPVRIRQRVYTIIGIADPQFSGTSPISPDLWIPITMRDEVLAGARLGDTEDHWLYVGGVLKAGLTRAQAHDLLLGLVQGMNALHPASAAVKDISLYPRATYVDLRPDMLMVVIPVFALFGLVLLIACADLANLLLARAASRQREIAVRLALGASRWRLVRQLLTESLVLSMAGTLAGYLLARVALDAIHGYLFSVYRALGYAFQPLTMDWRVFAYTAAVGVAAGIAFGLAPALEATSLDLARGIKQEGAAVSLRARPRRITDLLVTSQVAASLILMVLAGLLVRNAQHVSHLNTGYDLDTLVDLRFDGQKAKLVERLSHDPRVLAISEVWRTPLYGNLNVLPGLADGKARPLGYSYVDDRYFTTLEIPVTRGRNFIRQEMTPDARVAIVSEATAQRLWGSGDPLGRVLQVGEPKPGDRFSGGTFQVVGVVADVVSGGLYLGKDPTSVYFPAVAGDARNGGLIARVQAPVAPMIEELRRVCAQLDRSSSCEPRTLRGVAWWQVYPYQIAGNVASGVGMLALLLTCIGLYGVVAFAVVQRTREIGIRIALGATRVAVLGVVLRRSVRQVALGVAIGIPFCLALSKYAVSVIPMLETFDGLAYLMTPLLLIGVAMAASYLPARRAASVDPMIALREE